jgi:hypothetical protein
VRRLLLLLQLLLLQLLVPVAREEVAHKRDRAIQQLISAAPFA